MIILKIITIRQNTKFNNDCVAYILWDKFHNLEFLLANRITIGPSHCIGLIRLISANIIEIQGMINFTSIYSLLYSLITSINFSFNSLFVRNSIPTSNVELG